LKNCNKPISNKKILLSSDTNAQKICTRIIFNQTGIPQGKSKECSEFWAKYWKSLQGLAVQDKKRNIHIPLSSLSAFDKMIDIMGIKRKSPSEVIGTKYKYNYCNYNTLIFLVSEMVQ
jgi:hypothetical protein